MKIRYINTYRIAFLLLCTILAISLCIMNPAAVNAAEDTQGGSTAGVLHAFYPSNAVYSEQIQKYIDGVDSLSFAWSRLDAEDPGMLNITRGLYDNYGFFYPQDYLQPVRYAKSKGKPIQINIFMNGSDGALLLPYADKRAAMIQAISTHLQKDISAGEGIYFDGAVIDFESLRDTDSSGKPLLYEGNPISTYFVQFLTELKAQLGPLGKKLYVAVNPPLYFDGYDYKAILGIADRVIMMAHDYEPSESLRKDQILQYTGYDALNPIDSPAPIQKVKQALIDIQNSAGSSADLSKVWLQIAFDSAQWKYTVDGPNGWDSLDSTVLNKGGRLTPLYKYIKARVDNTDGYGVNISYGYNNELQSPFMQYYNSFEKDWNVVLYEDSSSIGAKIDLAKAYGLGGISVWSLGNLPDYNDAKGKQFHLDGWNTILAKVKTPYAPPAGGNAGIRFADKTVEQAVRGKLVKPSGSITASDMKSIYRLKLPAGVKNLNDLKNLTNLEYLDAQQLDIKDITPLSSLLNLRVLYLQRNRITDVSPLKKLTRLQILSLNGNQVTDLRPLSPLKELRELYLRENKVGSVAALSGLIKLNILHLGVNSIVSASSLASLKNVYVLSLDGNKLTSIKGLSGISGLKSLNLASNRITDIQALNNLKNLEILYLQRNSIKDIRALSGFVNLKELSFNGNQVSDVKSLAALTKLEKLYMKDNRIVNIASLKSLTNLKELYLSGNHITDYSPVNELYKQLVDSDFKMTAS